MESKVSILARIPEGDSYRLVTVQKKRGSYIQPEDAISFYVRYTDALTRERVTEPAGKDFDGARVKALNTETAQNAARNGQQADTVTAITPTSERMTVAEAVRQYLKHIDDRIIAWQRGAKKDGLSPNSKTTYTKTVKDFLAYCNDKNIFFMPKTDVAGTQESSEVSRKVLLDYKLHLYKTLKRRAGGQQSETIATRFRNLSAFLSFHKIRIVQSRRACDNRGLLGPNEMPVANTPGTNGAADVEVFSDEELRSMLAVADEDEEDFLQFFLKTGVRDDEAAHGEWSDIDFKASTLRVQDKPHFDWRVKDKEARTIPMEPKLLNRLKVRRARQEEQAKQDGQDAPRLIFPNTLGGIDSGLIVRLRKIVSKVKDWKAGSEVELHKFRKNYATLLHRSGYDLRSLQTLLGHANIKTTMRYVAADLTKAADISAKAFGDFGD